MINKITERPLGSGLDVAWCQVRDFHHSFNHPIGLSPISLDEDRKAKRVAWIQEELDELAEAGDIVSQVDASLDIIYFALGNLVEMGVMPQRLFDEVQKANMSKLGADGYLIYKEDGKVAKPDNWVAPEEGIEREINWQRENVSPVDNYYEPVDRVTNYIHAIYEKECGVLTVENSSGDEDNVFEDGYQCGEAWTLYALGVMLGLKLEEPNID